MWNVSDFAAIGWRNYRQSFVLGKQDIAAICIHFTQCIHNKACVEYLLGRHLFLCQCSALYPSRIRCVCVCCLYLFLYKYWLNDRINNTGTNKHGGCLGYVQHTMHADLGAIRLFVSLQCSINNKAYHTHTEPQKHCMPLSQHLDAIKRSCILNKLTRHIMHIIYQQALCGGPLLQSLLWLSTAGIMHHLPGLLLFFIHLVLFLSYLPWFFPSPDPTLLLTLTVILFLSPPLSRHTFQSLPQCLFRTHSILLSLSAVHVILPRRHRSEWVMCLA